MGIRISDLRNVFGANSSQARAAEFVDQNAPMTKYDGVGAHTAIRTSRNDLFDLAEPELKIAKDILFPPDLKEAFEQLVGIARGVGSPPSHAGKVDIRGHERRASTQLVAPTELPVAQFTGAREREAVALMLGHQQQKETLERTTVETFKNSAVFEKRYPGVIRSLLNFHFKTQQTMHAPPPVVEKVAISSPELRVTARLVNEPNSQGTGVKNHYSYLIQTTPNALVKVQPFDVRAPNPDTWNTQTHQHLNSAQVLRADADGNVEVKLDRRALSSAVKVFDPEGKKANAAAKVEWTIWR
jgi:hypothetical protein